MESRARSTTASLMSELDKAPLGRHVKPFTDKNGLYSPTSISAELNKCDEPHPNVVGAAIAIFNATHAEGSLVCPFRKSATFSPDSYAKSLHLGTTRTWNADGTINEERWQQFVNYVQEDFGNEKIVKQSKLNEYLLKCLNEDAEEKNTGRNNNSYFSSKSMQATAANAGWDEVFKLFHNGAVKDGKKEDRYLTIKAVREFFEDTGELVKKAENGVLPKNEPVVGVVVEASTRFKK